MRACILTAGLLGALLGCSSSEGSDTGDNGGSAGANTSAGSGGSATGGSAGTGNASNAGRGGSVAGGGSAGSGGSTAGASTGGAGTAGGAGRPSGIACGDEICGPDAYCKAPCNGAPFLDAGPPPPQNPSCWPLPAACMGTPSCECICGSVTTFCSPGASQVQCGCG